MYAPETSSSIRQLSVVRFIRRMRGGSQASLVQCDDGQYYVLKMSGNPQGPNILANELLGSVLAHAVGLPVTAAAMIRVSSSFLESLPETWFHFASGTIKPEAGLHFGSLFVGEVVGLHRSTEYISRTQVPFISNRNSFLGMYLLDVWADHQDHRQAVFLRNVDLRCFHATFLDHGHMFGGPEWDIQLRTKRACHLDMSVYRDLYSSDAVTAWIALLRDVLPHALSLILPIIPKQWFTGDLKLLASTLYTRLDKLDQLVEAHLGDICQKPAEISENVLLRLQDVGVHQVGIAC